MLKKISVSDDIYPLLKLVIPLVFMGLVQSAIWFFETLFLARLGTQTLAAGSLVSWLFGTLAVILFGTLSAINILVSHKHGEKDDEGIALVARDGIWLAVLITIPTMFLLWNIAPVFLLFGQSASVVALAVAYLHPLTWGLLANFIMMACLEVIIGIGHARLALIFSFLLVSMNVIFSYVLIFGKLGFSALGIVGAGWGATLSEWLAVVLLAIYILLHKNYCNYFRYVFKIRNPFFLLELVRVGFPIGGMYCVEVAFFFVLTLLMGLLGSQLQAANQVTLQYLGLLMAIIFSIAQAITVRMGHLLGAREKQAAEKAAYLGISMAAFIACVAALVYWFCPKSLISADFDIYNPMNKGIISDIEKFFVIAAVFQIFEAIRVSLFGALRGLRDTRFTLLVSIISFWGIAIPLGYFFAMYLKWDGVGFWWGMIFGAAFSVIVLYGRFKKRMSYIVRNDAN